MAKATARLLAAPESLKRMVQVLSLLQKLSESKMHLTKLYLKDTGLALLPTSPNTVNGFLPKVTV
jgi:hypothetical protein